MATLQLWILKVRALRSIQNWTFNQPDSLLPGHVIQGALAGISVSQDRQPSPLVNDLDNINWIFLNQRRGFAELRRLQAQLAQEAFNIGATAGRVEESDDVNTFLASHTSDFSPGKNDYPPSGSSLDFVDPSSTIVIGDGNAG
jgi:hypothetical protein